MCYWLKMMRSKFTQQSLVGLASFLSCFAVNALQLVETKTQLKKIETQINQLENHLQKSKNKRAVLTKELALIEKKTSSTVHNLSVLKQKIKTNEEKIAPLQQQEQLLNQQLKAEQRVLAQQLKARYALGKNTPLKWFFTESPQEVTHLLTLYQYIFKSRQLSIDKVRQTQKQLLFITTALQQELNTQRELAAQLDASQKQLANDKSYHANILVKLGEEIQTKQQSLQEFQANKVRLTQLIQQLQQQHLKIAQESLVYMRKKLPRPVNVATAHVQAINQGLFFKTTEGASVKAVYPGKVVFSDWLKGYGLLLIIDHGRGLMTLYAHNQSLFKQKGEIVSQGEQIATVGHTGGILENGLYFEIRQHGKVISPLKWLS